MYSLKDLFSLTAANLALLIRESERDKVTLRFFSLDREENRKLDILSPIRKAASIYLGSICRCAIVGRSHGQMADSVGRKK